MGLAGADKICNTLAANAHLPGNYAAYLSTPTVAAPSRVGGATGWVRVDGKPVMNAITQFAGGTMINPPSVMETGIEGVDDELEPRVDGTSTQGTFANACSAALSFIAWAGTSGSANMGLADEHGLERGVHRQHRLRRHVPALYSPRHRSQGDRAIAPNCSRFFVCHQNRGPRVGRLKGPPTHAAPRYLRRSRVTCSASPPPPRAPPRGAELVTTDGRSLPLVGGALRGEAQGGIARLVLEQRFENPYDETLHVTYRMPLPADGAVSGYAFVIGERDDHRRVDRKSARARAVRAGDRVRADRGAARAGARRHLHAADRQHPAAARRSSRGSRSISGSRGCPRASGSCGSRR